MIVSSGAGHRMRFPNPHRYSYRYSSAAACRARNHSGKEMGCAHFLKMEMNVLSFDPSLGCSSATGASGDGDGVAEEGEDVNAHMVQAPSAFLGTAPGKREMVDRASSCRPPAVFKGGEARM